MTLKTARKWNSVFPYCTDTGHFVNVLRIYPASPTTGSTPIDDCTERSYHIGSLHLGPCHFLSLRVDLMKSNIQLFPVG
ncbi:hypothetical protein SCLCIDRAFT_1215442 [Scleroderma citrinum Foug A]|uniref:Uncharacterized protein n=1 Tax=Scleroderma citrinum Foug A TaxID=1036808 RepID=A0A0C3E0U6_9AGAM|nr:hypothetical protein SCLCIDRAFT_1215442 [Scleroderma citrinum Foug A]